MFALKDLARKGLMNTSQVLSYTSRLACPCTFPGTCFITLDELHISFLEFVYHLRAKRFRENVNIYLHLMPILHIDLTQVLKILPQVKPGPTYST